MIYVSKAILSSLRRKDIQMTEKDLICTNKEYYQNNNNLETTCVYNILIRVNKVKISNQKTDESNYLYTKMVFFII